jgi:transposase-like protein
VAARLTDKQKKKIIADYTENGSYRATARMNGVSDDTVRRVVLSDDEILQKAAQKKEENTLDMLAYMDSRKEQAQGVIDDYLVALANPEKIASAKLSEIATALGIVLDKFTKNAPANVSSIEQQLKNRDALADLIRKPVPNRDIEDFE